MFNFFLQSDYKREGLQSRGKQPRLLDKDFNFCLSDKSVKKLRQS